MKRIYESFKTGIFIGIILSLLFSYLHGDGNYYISTQSFIVKFSSIWQATFFGMLMYGFIGILSNLAGSIFDKIENIFVATLIHYILILIIVGNIGIFMSWTSNILSLIITITIVYVVIYVVNYYLYKKRIEKINSKINN